MCISHYKLLKIFSLIGQNFEPLTPTLTLCSLSPDLVNLAVREGAGPHQTEVGWLNIFEGCFVNRRSRRQQVHTLTRPSKKICQGLNTLIDGTVDSAEYITPTFAEVGHFMSLLIG